VSYLIVAGSHIKAQFEALFKQLLPSLFAIIIS